MDGGEYGIDDARLILGGLDKARFGSLPAPRRIIEAWRSDYNTTRLYASLNELAPAAFATRLVSRRRENRRC